MPKQKSVHGLLKLAFCYLFKYSVAYPVIEESSKHSGVSFSPRLIVNNFVFLLSLEIIAVKDRRALYTVAPPFLLFGRQAGLEPATSIGTLPSELLPQMPPAVFLSWAIGWNRTNSFSRGLS